MKHIVCLFLVSVALVSVGCQGVRSNGRGTYTYSLGILGNKIKSGYTLPVWKQDTMPQYEEVARRGSERSGVLVANSHPGLRVKMRWALYYQPAYWNPILQEYRPRQFVKAFDFPLGRPGQSFFGDSPELIPRDYHLDVYVAFVDEHGREVSGRLTTVYVGGMEHWTTYL